MRLTQRAVEPVMGSRAVVALLAVLGTLLVSSLLRAVPSSEIAFANLNPVRATPQGHRAGQKLLVLTPLKDGAAYLDAYFANLQRLNYPPRLISLAFLVSDSTDDTIARLQSKARRIQATSQRFADITILQKDFHFKLPNSARHGFEGQPVRRAFIARARNYLLTAALKWDHAWVLWLDVDVVRYDPDILMDLMRVDKDIVVPNTLWYQDKERQWDFWGFDRNNFAETEESLALIKRLGPDVMLVEGTSPPALLPADQIAKGIESSSRIVSTSSTCPPTLALRTSRWTASAAPSRLSRRMFIAKGSPFRPTRLTTRSARSSSSVHH